MYVQQLADLAISPSTHKLYAHAWELFQEFSVTYGFSTATPSEHQLIEFVSYLSLNSFAATTIQLYLSGVRYNLKMRGLNPFTSSFILSMVVKGATSRFKNPDICLPISLRLLHEFWHILPTVLHDNFLVLMYRSLLTFTFHGLFRSGEVTYSPHSIKAEDIYFVKGHLHVYLASSKAHRGPGQQRVIIQPQPTICPAQDLVNYLHVRPKFPGALYRKQSGVPLQYPELLKLMGDLASFCNLPRECFMPHSIGIGSTTHLHLQGFDSQVIKTRGRWSSQVFKRYIQI